MRILILFMTTILLAIDASGQSNLFTISGRVECGQGAPMDNAIVWLLDSAGRQVDMAITAPDGAYSIDSVPGGVEMNYEITVAYDPSISGELNGISTFDMVLISRHILGIGNPLSAVQVQAGDVNQSKTLTTFDLVLLRRLILQLDIAVDVPPLGWLFYQDENAGTQSTFAIKDLLEDTVFNVSAIKRGDINWSAICRP